MATDGDGRATGEGAVGGFLPRRPLDDEEADGSNHLSMGGTGDG